jgi:hypothetical protein
VDHAQQRPDRQPTPVLEPRLELAPRPSVHVDLTSLAALAALDKDRPANGVEVALLQTERLANPKPRTPQEHDQRTESLSGRAITDGAHHRDDLLDGWRAGWVLLARPCYGAADRGGSPASSPASAGGGQHPAERIP